MQTYKYSAISKDGAKVSGVIEAFDEFAAVATIKETCSVVTKIQAVEQQGLLTRDVFTPKIKERDLAVMCSQFAIILGAGLPMVRAVELIASETEDRRLKELLNQVAGDVPTALRPAAASSPSALWRRCGQGKPPARWTARSSGSTTTMTGRLN